MAQGGSIEKAPAGESALRSLGLESRATVARFSEPSERSAGGGAREPMAQGGSIEKAPAGEGALRSLGLESRATVCVVCAGSTDLPVAREALETLGWMQVAADLIVDVGVAGPYRLLPHLDHLRDAVAVVVIAGMEGALASVVGGLVPCPIIAVPTSVGYGLIYKASLHC